MFNSYKRFTVIGFLLMATSLVVAAVVPGQSVKLKTEGDNNGTLRPEATGTLNTCFLRDGAQSCNVTIDTSTTREGQDNSYTGLFNTDQTETNTSQSEYPGHPESSYVD
jgi:hypothetical protein